MEIKSIEVRDTSGVLSKPIWKTTPSEPGTLAWFDMSKSNKRQLNVAPTNVDFEAANSISSKYTYKAVLVYNGTMSTKDRLFKNIVKESSGVFTTDSDAMLTYSPDGLEMPPMEALDDVVMDISMHTGMIDVLEYREGELTRGGKSYAVKARHSYPTIIKTLPNIEKDVVFLDGWYSYTFIKFVDVEAKGATAFVGEYYSFKGKIFKATRTGAVIISGNQIYIVDIHDFDVEDIEAADISAELQDDEGDFADMIMSLYPSDGVGDNYNHAYIESQLLVTDELRDAITNEILCTAMCDTSACDFADWQKLALKRQAAAIMFWNELYRNAQVVIESSRKMCQLKLSGKC